MLRSSPLLAGGWNKYRPVIGGILVKPDFEPRPLRRWQLTQAPAAPSMRMPPSRVATSGAPDGSTPSRKILSPGSADDRPAAVWPPSPA